MSAERLCSVCGSGTWKRLGSSPDFDGARIYRCQRCAFVTTLPLPTEVELTTFYGGAYSATRGGSPAADLAEVYAARAGAQADMIEREIGSVRDRTVMEYGCGFGFLALELAERGARVRALDPDPLAVQHAASLTRGRDVTVDIGTLGQFESEGLRSSVVALSHVLEHSREPVRVLRGLVEALDPGGVLFVEVPNHDPRRVRALIRRRSGGTGHLHFFTAPTLSQVVRVAGGEMVAVVTAGISMEGAAIPYGSPRGPLDWIRFAIERQASRWLAGTGREEAFTADAQRVERPASGGGRYLRLIARRADG